MVNKVSFERLGIVVAMDQEIAHFLGDLSNEFVTSTGPTLETMIATLSIVVYRCGIGKVNAALAATRLIDKFGCDAILVVGISGSLDPFIGLGDVVVASGAFQHDFDLRPIHKSAGILPGCEIPVIDSDSHLSERIVTAAMGAFLTFESQLVGSQILLGTVASGDQIIATDQDKNSILNIVRDTLCVDMETGAVAQICKSALVPWTALRVISDFADSNFDPESVLRFARQDASPFISATLTAFANDN